MAVVLLRELMNTRYMIQSLTQRFENCLEQCKRNGDTVDLSGCRLGPECANKMRAYYATLDFCNTEDEYLDAMLKNNCEAARQILDSYEVLNLEKVNSLDTFFDLVKTIPQNAKLEPKISFTNVRSKVTLIMLIMARPDIEFDIRKCAADIFDFVREFWISSSEHHEQYSELVAPDITTRAVNEKGLYGDMSYGFTDEYKFIRQRKVLPIEFGNSQIIVLDKNQQVSEEWRGTVEKCLNMFKTSKKQNRIPGKTVKDFLTFREDD
jgi:hypothetical protein